ncbi:hypothetical protein EDB19DRAFT_1939462 [Suillus lakei]|nr:hypothetical protein EDB19DRAFT_1939462 [Suillus lakei]
MPANCQARYFVERNRGTAAAKGHSSGFRSQISHFVGGGQSGLMCAARLGRLGIRALVIEKNARVGDSWRKRYPNLTLHTPAYQSSIVIRMCLPQFKGITYLSNVRTTFPKYIPKGKLANFLESYAVDQELCIWLSSSTASTPTYDSTSARWTVEVQHGDRKEAEALAFLLGMGWMNFKEPCIIPTSIKTQSSSEANTSSLWVRALEQTHFKLSFPDDTPIEALDFRMHSMPLAFLLQLQILGGTQYMKMLDKELHEALRKVGFNLTWEPLPGSGEVGLEGFLFSRIVSGTMLDIGCGKPSRANLERFRGIFDNYRN